MSVMASEKGRDGLRDRVLVLADCGGGGIGRRCAYACISCRVRHDQYKND